MHAETAYLFRHALLRDAAYQLQLPGDRARLHALAIAAIEELAGGRPPEPPAVDALESVPLDPHPSDPWARELAGHAREAGDGASWREAEKRWLRRAAEQAEKHALGGAAVELWKRHADLSRRTERGESLRRAGFAAFGAGLTAAAEALYERAIELQRESRHRRLEGAAVANLAQLLQETGRWKQAAPMLEEALRISREADDRETEVYALKHQARLLLLTGHPREAEETCERALATARAAGLQLREFSVYWLVFEPRQSNNISFVLWVFLNLNALNPVINNRVTMIMSL